LPYAYHGKDGPEFKWLDSEKGFPPQMSSTKEGGEIIGLIPDALREIMAKKKIIDEIPGLKEIAERLEFTEERARYHTARAVMYMLAGKGCIIKDYVTPTHLEWIDFLPKAKDFLTSMMKKGMFPREAEAPLWEVIETHLGKKSFQDEFANCLKENSYWLPREMRGEEDRFAFFFESACMSPNFPDMGDEDSKKMPKRVRVWNGDQTQYLGEGDYAGKATVYFIRMEDGSIQSNHDAEIEPDADMVPDGASVICSEDNPKFVLDSGDTVYGCQVWWEPVEDAPKKQHKEFGGWNKAK